MRFDQMVGQEQVATTLKNAIRTGHLAHSFLFCGPRGVGKTTAARILAKTINCENIGDDFEACGQCSSCISFSQNASFNIHELDAASNNSVEDIRALVDQVRFPPQSGKYKIYIIDEVHMLSSSAFNAFLKTLEEPPAYCKFILATTEKHKILPTILSRCQIFDFKRIPVETIVKHLRNICDVEKTNAEDSALHVIALKADGGMRDALSMFDRLASFGGGELKYNNVLENLNVLDYDYYFKVTDMLVAEDVAGVLHTFNEIISKGFEGDDFMMGLSEHFRNLLFCKDPQTIKLLETGDSIKSRYAEQTNSTTADFLVNCLHIANQCDVQYKTSKNKRLTVEVALIKMCYVNAVVTAETDDLKKKVDTPEHTPPKTNILNKPADTPTPVTEVKQTLTAQVSETTNSPKPEPATRTIVADVKVTKTKRLITLDTLANVQESTPETVAENGAESMVSATYLLNEETAQELWDKYAETLPEERIGMKLNFATFKPVLNELELIVQVYSFIQQQQFEEIKAGLEHFFFSYTGQKVKLAIQTLKSENQKTKPYTPKEKLERLIEKNPNIKSLQQQMGLEFDYDY